MTRKDFELIARVLRNSTELGGAERVALAWEFAGALRETNGRFDAQRFVKACSVRPKVSILQAWEHNEGGAA